MVKLDDESKCYKTIQKQKLKDLSIYIFSTIKTLKVFISFNHYHRSLNRQNVYFYLQVIGYIKNF